MMQVVHTRTHAHTQTSAIRHYDNLRDGDASFAHDLWPEVLDPHDKAGLQDPQLLGKVIKVSRPIHDQGS